MGGAFNVIWLHTIIYTEGVSIRVMAVHVHVSANFVHPHLCLSIINLCASVCVRVHACACCVYVLL